MVERLRDPLEKRDRYVAFAALELREITLGHAGGFGQAFLDIPLRASHAHAFPDNPDELLLGEIGGL